MKRYKLIKQFPHNYPNWELGIIVAQRVKPFGDDVYYPEDDPRSSCGWHADYIEKWPEFWEEIKE